MYLIIILLAISIKERLEDNAENIQGGYHYELKTITSVVDQIPWDSYRLVTINATCIYAYYS